MIPQGLAYSSLALVPPIYGLVTAFVPLLIYVVMGTSRQISMGPEAMVSILVGETTMEYLSEVGLPDTQVHLRNLLNLLLHCNFIEIFRHYYIEKQSHVWFCYSLKLIR